MARTGDFVTLIVEMIDGTKHRMRVEESLLRVRTEFELAVEQQRRGNLPQQVRIVAVRRAQPGE